MKIIKIEMKNLNSLKGSWEIDFTDSSFSAQDNQFVIRGITGAGKTTIFDAITLGLYGRTPRQKITASENQVMCRTQGECMAAVTYECEKGIFRSEFYQNKANCKSKGKLQSPKFKIENLNTGEFAKDVTTASKFEKENSNNIKLDYDQFCRSVLLAQGSFDKFIKGTEREKADILAKLSDTSHYKTVASNLWKEANDVINKYDEEAKAIEGIVLLPDDVIDKLNDEIRQINASNEELSNKNKDIQEKINWKKELENKIKIKEAAEKAQVIFEEEKAKFEQQKDRLESANRAAKCEASYKSFIEADNDYKIAKDNQIILKTKRDQLEADFGSAEDKFKTLSKVCDEVEAKRQPNTEIWNKVRTIDNNICLLEKQCQELLTRKEDAKKEYEDNAKIVKESLDLIEDNKKQIAELTEYISAHAKDEQLAEIIPGLKEKKNVIDKLCSNIKERENSFNNLKGEFSKKEELKNSLKIEVEQINSELEQYVSQNYKTISEVIRNKSLKEGMACPVCGALDHPFCNQEHISSDTNSTKVTEKVAKLSEKLQEKEQSLNECEQKSHDIQGKMQNVQEELAQSKDSLDISIKEINDIISPWQLLLGADNLQQSFVDIDTKLKELSRDYVEKKNTLDKLQNENIQKDSIVKSIKIDKSKDKFEEENQKYEKQINELQVLKTERTDLFGTADVDKAEKDFDESLEKAKADRDKANANRDKLKSEFIKANRDYENNQKHLTNDLEKLEKTKNEFETDIKNKGFDSLEEFKNSVMGEAERERLNQERELLNNREIEVTTTLKDATNNFKVHSEKALTEKSVVELENLKHDIEESVANGNKRKGEIQKELEINEQHIHEKNNLLEEHKKNYGNVVIYENIKKMIGVKTGDDFEVFVQRMVMKNLLVCSNKYLEMILKNYSFVQVDNSLDCLLHDTDHPEPENDRPISNLSGGELFSVSLALALGITELASNRVKMDLLFLDEGFGTLSGEPLMNAIDSLKKLKSTGKMLGIVTHVDQVIDAFDVKITAKKQNGYSVLEGPGVTKVTGK